MGGRDVVGGGERGEEVGTGRNARGSEKWGTERGEEGKGQWTTGREWREGRK
jgi:hypothetical protein